MRIGCLGSSSFSLNQPGFRFKLEQPERARTASNPAANQRHRAQLQFDMSG